MTGRHAQKRILVSWYNSPAYIPPFRLSNAQVTLGPKVRGNEMLGILDGWSPRGRYCLADALASNGLGTDFDAIVVFADATGVNLPMQLDDFDCPKVLCAGDT